MRHDTHYLVEQIAAIRSKIADLENRRNTSRAVQVLAADSGTSTFSVALPTGETLSGLAAPAQFLPAVGEWGRLRLDGATPIWEPGSIAENAITTRELSDGAVTIDQLAFNIADYTGGTTIFYGATTPTATGTGDLWLKELSAGPPPVYETRRWTGTTWNLLADQTATNAILLAQAAQAAADLKAQLFSQTSAPTGLTASDKAIWVDTDDGNVSYTWTGSGWTKRQLGNGAIQPNSLVASNVIATGTVTAALLETLMVLTNTLVAGDPNGEHARMTSTGLTAQAVDPGSGLPITLARYGRGLAVMNPVNGQVTASISDLGDIVGRNLYVSDPDPEFGGTTLSALLWNKAWGLVGHAEFAPTGGFSGSTTTEIPIWELAFTGMPGRAYRICSTPMMFAADVGSKGYVRSRRTTNGTAPTTGSSLYTEAYMTAMDTGWGQSVTLNYLVWGPTSGTTADNNRILFTLAAVAGATVKMWKGVYTYFWVEDIGPLPTERGQVAGATNAKTTLTQEYAASWTRSWRANGTTISYDDPMYQGYGDSVNGKQTSAVGFPSVTTTLTGAVVNKVELWLYAETWLNQSGVANLSYHASTTEPASSPAGTSMGTINYSGRGQGMWIDVTGWASQLQAGTFRGILLSAPDNTAPYFGRFSGASGGTSGLPPKLRITWTK